MDKVKMYKKKLERVFRKICSLGGMIKKSAEDDGKDFLKNTTDEFLKITARVESEVLPKVETLQETFLSKVLDVLQTESDITWQSVLMNEMNRQAQKIFARHTPMEEATKKEMKRLKAIGEKFDEKLGSLIEDLTQYNKSYVSPTTGGLKTGTEAEEMHLLWRDIEDKSNELKSCLDNMEDAVQRIHAEICMVTSNRRVSASCLYGAGLILSGGFMAIMRNRPDVLPGYLSPGAIPFIAAIGGAALYIPYMHWLWQYHNRMMGEWKLQNERFQERKKKLEGCIKEVDKAKFKNIITE